MSLLNCASHQRLAMVLPKKAATQLHEVGDFIATFTRELLDDHEPVPKVRQMINEAGYIDYIYASRSFISSFFTGYLRTYKHELNKGEKRGCIPNKVEELITRIY